MRDHLLKLLSGEGAHLTFDDAVEDYPQDYINIRPPNVLYTPWHLIEHMRIAQRDILEFIRNPEHVSPEWPVEYWPAVDAAAGENGWDQTIASYRADLEEMKKLVRAPEADFLAEFPHAPGYNLLREILTVADHNAYHTGELAILRQVMSTWPESRQP